MERLCETCKHYRKVEDVWTNVEVGCYALKGTPHPEHGKDIDYIRPDLMRLTLCGWKDPKFWEQKR
jgi:hypothetical protein